MLRIVWRSMTVVVDAAQPHRPHHKRPASSAGPRRGTPSARLRLSASWRMLRSYCCHVM